MSDKITTYSPYPVILFWALIGVTVTLTVLVLKDLYKTQRVAIEMQQHGSHMISNFFAGEMDKVKSERDSLQTLLNQCQNVQLPN